MKRKIGLRDLRGRHCLVTGAASGIGRATALAAARRGAILHLTDLDRTGLEGTVAEIGRSGGEVATSRAFDLRDHDSVTAFAEDVHESRGSLDVVMNVAGISTWGPIEAMSREDWTEVIEVDLLAPIGVLEAFVPAMIAAGRGGHIVNLSSGAGLLGVPWHAAYSAAKFGLRGISEVLRFDLERHRIGVSLVCPGGVRTPLMDRIRIVGVDADEAGARRLISHFERHTVSPGHVAERILRGIERNRYLVFTSADVRLAFLAQRWCPPLYERAMRRMNDRLVETVRSLENRSGSRPPAWPQAESE